MFKSNEKIQMILEAHKVSLREINESINKTHELTINAINRSNGISL